MTRRYDSSSGIPLWFPFVFIGAWLAATGLIKLVSGWNSLATKYTTNHRSVGRRFYFVSALIGATQFPVNYNNCLTVFVATDGFYIQPIFISALFSPRIFIPWRDVQIVETSYLFFFSAHRIQVKNSWVTFLFYGSLGKIMLEYWTASRSSLETQWVS